MTRLSDKQHTASIVRSLSLVIMSALLLDAGEVKAGIAESDKHYLSDSARFCTSNDCGTPLEEPVTVNNRRASSSVGAQARTGLAGFHITAFRGI